MIVWCTTFALWGQVMALQWVIGKLVVLFYGISTLLGLFNAELSHFDKNLAFVWFYGISSMKGYLMSNPFLYIWKVLFQTIQFNLSTQFIWPIDRTLSGAIIPGQRGPRNNSNEGILHISQYHWSPTIRLFNVISRTLICEESLTPQQRYNQYILQSLSIGLQRVRWTKFLHGFLVQGKLNFYITS